MAGGVGGRREAGGGRQREDAGSGWPGERRGRGWRGTAGERGRVRGRQGCRRGHAGRAWRRDVSGAVSLPPRRQQQQQQQQQTEQQAEALQAACPSDAPAARRESPEAVPRRCRVQMPTRQSSAIRPFPFPFPPPLLFPVSRTSSKSLLLGTSTIYFPSLSPPCPAAVVRLCSGRSSRV